MAALFTGFKSHRACVRNDGEKTIAIFNDSEVPSNKHFIFYYTPKALPNTEENAYSLFLMLSKKVVCFGEIYYWLKFLCLFLKHPVYFRLQAPAIQQFFLEKKV